MGVCRPRVFCTNPRLVKINSKRSILYLHTKFNVFTHLHLWVVDGRTHNFGLVMWSLQTQIKPLGFIWWSSTSWQDLLSMWSCISAKNVCGQPTTIFEWLFIGLQIYILSVTSSSTIYTISSPHISIIWDCLSAFEHILSIQVSLSIVQHYWHRN